MPFIPALASIVATVGYTAAAVVGAAGAISLGTAYAIGGVLLAAGTALTVKAFQMFDVEMPQADSDASRTYTTKGTVQPVKIVYGEALVSGPITYVGVAGDQNQDLYHCIALTGHISEEVKSIYFDDIEITTAQRNASGQVTSGRYAPVDDVSGVASTTVVTINTHDGTYGNGEQNASRDSLLGSAFSSDWTSNHLGQKITYMVTKFTLPDSEKAAELWDKYTPTNIKAIVKGVNTIYDPRDDTSVGANPGSSTYQGWSDNPALCLANYLTDSEFGVGIPASKIDWQSVADAANDCDATVNIPNSQTQKAFTCNGILFGTDSHKSSISKLLSAMNGNLIYSNGKYYVHAGAWIDASETLNENDLRGPVSIKTSVDRGARFNTIKPIYASPSDNYKMMELPPVTISGVRTRDNNEVLEKQIQLPLTNNSFMAQRIAHQLVNRSSDQRVLTFPANLKGLRIKVGDRVSVTISEFGYTAKTFQCIGWSFSDGDSGGVDLTLIEDTEGRYDPPAASFYSEKTNDGTINEGFPGVSPPTSLTATGAEKRITVAWTNPKPASSFSRIYVYGGNTNVFANHDKVWQVNTETITEELASGTQRYYWVRAVKTGDSATSGYSTLLGPVNATASTITADSVEWVDVDNKALGIDITGDTITILDTTASVTGQDVATSGMDAGITLTDTGGGIVMNAAGAIRSQGRTDVDFSTGSAGYFLGYHSNAYKFGVGNSTESMVWDGSNLTVTGEVNATGGTFSGNVQVDDYITVGGTASSSTIAGLNGVSADEIRVWAGDTYANIGLAPFRVESDGTVYATRLVVSRPGDETATIFDSAQDGLVGVGLTSISQETGIVVQEASVTLASQTATQQVTLAASQTVTIDVNFALGYSPFSITDEEDFPDDITLTVQYSTDNGSSWSTFDSAATKTRRVYGVYAPSNSAFYSVYDSGTAWYKSNKDAIPDKSYNLYHQFSASLAADDYLFRCQVSFTSGANGVTTANPSTSANRNLLFTTDGAGWTISEAGVISDAPGSTASIGYVSSNYVALEGSNQLDLDSGYFDIDDGGYSRFRVDADNTRATEEFQIQTSFGANPTPAPGSAKAFRITHSTTDFFSITQNGYITALGITADSASFGGGYGSTGTTIASDGDISTDGDVIIGGNLTVAGDTITANVGELTVEDKNITLNYSTGDSSATANGAGITVQDAVNSSTDATLSWATANDSWEFSHQLTAPTLRLTATGDAALGSTTHAFQVGATNSNNVIIDQNEVMARVNGAESTLHFNPDGGNVSFRNNGSGTTNLVMSGNVFLDHDRNLTVTSVNSSGTISSGSNIGNLDTTNDLGQVLEVGNASTATLRFDSDAWRLYAGGASGIGTVFSITEGGAAVFSRALETGGNIDLNGYGISSDNNGLFYSWRAINNTASSTTNYKKIARITGSQSTRFMITLTGKASSYGDGSKGSKTEIYGQLNNDNNYDITYTNFDFSATDVAVNEIGFVDVGTASVDIYVKVASFSELAAFGVISDGSIAPDSTSSATTTAPSGYTVANANTIWTDESFSSTDITEWNTAYTYSQVGHLPLAGGTLTGNVDAGNNAIKARIFGRSTTSTAHPNLNVWDYNHGTYPGHVHIVANSEGTDGTTPAGQIRFYVYDGTNWNLPLTIAKDSTASFSGNVNASGYIYTPNYIQTATGYFSANLNVLNAAGNGWHTWATRSNGNYNLSVGTITSGAITSSGASSFGSGTTIGSVEADGSSIGNAQAGITFQPNANYRCIHPVSLTATAHSSDISLGWSNNKWKDIYLAGYVKADSGYQVNGLTVIDSGGAITATANANALTVKTVTNGEGADIQFIDHITNDSQQIGYLTHRHTDGASYGSGASFVFHTNQSTLSVLADGKLLFKEGLYVKPASGTGAGTEVISSSRNFYPYQVRASGSDTSPLGVNFSNTIKGQGTSRTIYFEGYGSSVSTWYGVGNNPFSAIDSTDGVMDIWVNNSSGTWRNVADFSESGFSITYGALRIGTTAAINKSGNYMVMYDGSGGAAIYAGNTADNRNYYQSTHHRFRADDAATNFAELSATGLRLGSASTPSEKLHVDGNVRADGSFNVSGTTVIDSSRNLVNIPKLNGYTITKPNLLEWTGLTAYAYDTTNGVRYYWHRIAQMPSSSGKLELEVNLKTDENYPHAGSAKIWVSTWNSTSLSVFIDRYTGKYAGTAKIEVWVDNSRYVWIRGIAAWSHYFEYRVIRQNGVSFPALYSSITQPANIYNCDRSGLGYRFLQSNIAAGPNNMYSYPKEHYEFDANNAYLMNGTSVIDVSRNGLFAGVNSAGSIHIQSGNLTIGDVSNTNTGSLYLRGSTANKQARLFCSNGNLHMDSDSGNSMYLNYYNGNVVYFGTGNTGTAGYVSSSGNALFTGNVTAYGSVSDISLKTDIEVIPDALAKVQQLRGVTFKYKKDDKRSTGLIAQELQEVLPEVVYTYEDKDEGTEHLAVRYGNVTGLLVESIKELKKENDELRAMLAQIMEKLNDN